MSLWTNGSSVDLFPGTKTPPPDSNSSNRTVGPPGAAPLDLSRAVPVGMVLASFIMFAIVGNILVILSVVCNRHLRIPTNYFIINLAIADLLLGTTVLPVSATEIFSMSRAWATDTPADPTKTYFHQSTLASPTSAGHHPC
ncbi:alpha-1B adrenergic receptor-like [Haplochromis burtoni]|uniref:alpha-1B adrenergic receptor-like n=1 Tax=Haplochromis burtoni TaxID=8153 RepID=UPI001C2D2B24|nr:alpha-1B adrenergic receptor-like [Haplochromis burtoni]